jgi:hypothetical protein
MPSPDQRLMLHVGAHVAGARQVQRYLRESVDQLKSQGLASFPVEVMAERIGWGGRLVDGPDRFARAIREALQAPGVRGVLGSHENTLGRPFDGEGRGLYAGARPALTALAGASEPYPCTVVLSVRPQADFLESYYAQTVNEGSSHTFDDWLGALDLDDLSWLPLHKLLVETFGVDGVRVLDYERFGGDPVAHVREFFRLMDVALPAHPEVTPVGISHYSEKGLRVTLAANPHLRTYDERAGLRAFVRKNFSTRKHPTARLLTDDQRAWLNTRYAHEYLQLLAGQPIGGADVRP